MGGWTKRFPTHTPRLCRWLVALCGLCPLALPPGPRTPASGQQVAELVHVESLPKRTALQPPRDRPPVGTSATEENPAQPRKAQEGRLRGGKEGRPSSGIEVPANLTPPLREMHRITSGVNLRTAGCVPVAGRRSDGCARGGGTGGRTTTQWCQRSRGSVTTPTALRQGQLRRFLWVLLPTTVSRDKDSCRTSAVQRLERRAAATARGSFRVPNSDVWAGAGSHISTLALRFYPTRPGLARSGPRDSPGPSRAISGRLAAVGSPVPGPG